MCIMDSPSVRSDWLEEGCDKPSMADTAFVRQFLGCYIYLKKQAINADSLYTQ